MKKLALIATLFASVTLFAQTELVDFSKLTLDSWGGSGNPEVSLAGEVISIKIVGTPGWQWGNQVKVGIPSIAENGLSKDKEYKVSFHAESSTGDCSGVTFKMFDKPDGKPLFFTDKDYLNFSAPFDFDSGWLKVTDDEQLGSNGILVWDFGWDPAQTITISNLSLLERDASTAMVNVIENKVTSQKVLEDGQLIIIKDGVRYNANGTIVK